MNDWTKSLSPPFATRGRRPFLRWLTPVMLVLFFLCILLWLPWQVRQMESHEHQEQLIADTLWVEQAIRFQLGRLDESARLLGNDIALGMLAEDKFLKRATTMQRNNRAIYRMILLAADDEILASTGDLPLQYADFSAESREAADRARKTGKPQYSRPTGPPGLQSPLLLDYYVPLYSRTRYIGALVTSYRISSILDDMVPWWFARDNEIVLADNNDVVIAKRMAGGAGRNVFTHRRPLDLPGLTLSLRTNSLKTSPKMMPNLLVGSVIVLALGLVWSLLALWRDVNRRLAAEDALRQQVAFRKAMENSLITGLRARDLKGRITYVNRAFCQMVGIPSEQLIGIESPMPYWAPEAMEVYQERFSQVLAGTITPQFETVFQRANGERFPVLIFESPLVDDTGKQTGWMGSILDISDRRRAEDLNRIHAEKLQGSARLSSMGELASTLAHELNQPLAAISSYTTGAINLMASGTVDPAVLRPALEKANVQAQRAGQIIRSVHEFVKKREPAREPVDVQALFDSVIPLVELQARQSFVAIQTSFAPGLPKVSADRVMIEQVLLNLTRNAIEAMQQVPPERRILRIVARASRHLPRQNYVDVQVIDQGHGIPMDVAERLFSPFFSTKAEGMGMGLSICRTTIEFHGGTLTHLHNPLGGTIFRFSLPGLPMDNSAATALPAASPPEANASPLTQ